MKNPDGSISLAEDYKVTATELWLRMDMLDFEYISLKFQLAEAGRMGNYNEYRHIERKEIPRVQYEHGLANNALWNFLKECVPDIGLDGRSLWSYDPEAYTVYEKRRPAKSDSGLFLPPGL